jgi:phosphoglycolate phosphatase-like HAD superfamily hydrolase
VTAEVLALLRSAAVVFWDFDGVIKDSVEVKSVGFERLFASYGAELAARVRRHHEAHGGVSRFEKIPVYLGWVNEPVTPARIRDFSDRFSALVLQAVVDSPWVPGVREYLQAHHERQPFVLVTATPQDEIEQILKVLGIGAFFRAVHGAPLAKSAAIGAALERLRCPAARALMVGDAETDLKAAETNGVPFLLRRTGLNTEWATRFPGQTFEGLTHE